MKTFDTFYDGLTDMEKVIVDRLRELVLEAHPYFQEKISYGVPYYFLNTRVCFIWPASVKPGPKAGVALGLCHGHLLSNEQGILEQEGRRQVYMITFHRPEDIREEPIREILQEAILVDEQFQKKGKGSRER